MRSNSFHRQNVQRLAGLSCKRGSFTRVVFFPAHQSPTESKLCRGVCREEKGGKGGSLTCKDPGTMRDLTDAENW
jgi:hypothetical protein